MKAEIHDGSDGPSGEDWSLRANGATYFDRNDETASVLDRIRNSSATVTGIAGLRGAGKSSLAMRVLKKCEEEDGAFTLLVHSPTSYEPKEFLISIFQRCCEDVAGRVDALLGQARTLQDRGQAQLSDIRRKLIVLVLGTLLIASMLGGYLYYEFQNTQNSDLELRLEIQSQDISENDDEILKLLSIIRNSFLIGFTQEDIKSREDFQNIQRRPGFRQYMDENFSEERRDQFTERRGELQSLIDTREGLINVYEGLKSQQNISVTTANIKLIIQGLLLLTLYISAVFLIRGALRLNNRRKQAKQYPLEIGLRAAAQEMLEILRFQSTTRTSASAKLSLAKLGGSVGRERSLEARDLSLPGLTAAFGSFLEQVAEVYSGKVVICLDELDKIEKIEDLDSLLRAVKGVLGHRNTHFLLTVSEDALARYSTRRRMERGMLESSFESMTLLGRLNSGNARHILVQMGVLSGTDDFDKTRASLFWMSAAAIPREIKRSAVSLRQSKIDLSATTPEKIWLFLFQDKVDDLILWGTRLDISERLAFSFLGMMKEVEASVETARPPTLRRAGVISDVCLAFERQMLELSESTSEDAADAERVEILNGMIRAALEVRAELLSLAIAQGRLAPDAPLNDALIEFFEALPANALYARSLLNRIIVDRSAALPELQSVVLPISQEPSEDPVHADAEA